jgi:hypothetical protein
MNAQFSNEYYSQATKVQNFLFLLILIVLLFIEISLHLIYKIQYKSFLYERVATVMFVEDDWCCYKNKLNLNYIQSNQEFIKEINANNSGNKI